MTTLFLFSIIVILSIIFAVYFRIVRSKPWLPNYFKWKITKNIFVKKRFFPTHVMFLFVDHFEPWEDTNDGSMAKTRIDAWCKNYPPMARQHCDADGNMPQHTWFYLIEDWKWKEHDANFLKQLGALSYNGLGEVELHIHHGSPQRIFPEIDTSEKLQELIEKQTEFYAEYGSLITAEKKPQKRFGFIHGKWALDNGMNGMYCGVDNELEILQNTGCFADFTMPSGIESQAKKLNSIYYPRGNPALPKSYNIGVDLKVGECQKNGLVMFSGMIAIYYRNLFLQNPIFEKSNLDGFEIPTKRRIDQWIKCNIHVEDRPEWVFIKVHSHGARQENFNVSFGELADEMYSYLEKKYNDGDNYRLHYVTAREAFNMAKAAEWGKKGDPANFRDFLIKPYANKKIKTNNPYHLISYNDLIVKIKFTNFTQSVESEFKHPFIKKIVSEELNSFEFNFNESKNRINILLEGSGKTLITLNPQIKKLNEKVIVKNAVLNKEQKETADSRFVLESSLKQNEKKLIELALS